ncbi:hypothetical protein [Peribacillus asahii]
MVTDILVLLPDDPNYFYGTYQVKGFHRASF